MTAATISPMIAPTIWGVILAGGRSSRMGGGDKALLALAGRPMLAHVVDRLAPQVAALALSANGDPGRFAAFGLPVLPDPVPGQPGPLAGILAGLDWAAERGARAVVSTPADTPFLPRDLVARLAAAGDLSRPVVVTTPGAGGGVAAHPASALWPVACRAALRAALAAGERRVGAFAEAEGSATVLLAAAGFRNLNTPADLAEAEALLARRD